MSEKRWPRLLGEFGVIFVSILLALLADDWREARSEREDGLDALELILADLESDARGFGYFQERLQQQARAAADFLREVDQGGSEEAVEQHYGGIVLYYNFEVGAAAYRGLAGSGGLRLIESDTIVAALASYYDGSIAYMDGLRTAMERDADGVAAAGHRHFVRTPPRDPDGALVLDGGWAFRLSTSVDALQADRPFLASVGSAGSSANWLALRIDDLYLERNAVTTRYVRDYLQRNGRDPTSLLGGG